MNRIFKYALMFAFVGIAMFAINQMSDGAEAADITWDGGGTTNNVTEGANWIGDIAPVGWDVAIFDGTSDKNANLNIAFYGSLDVRSGYDGTITQMEPFSTGGWLKLQDGTFIQNFAVTYGALDLGAMNYIWNNGTQIGSFFWLTIGTNPTMTADISCYRLFIEGNINQEGYNLNVSGEANGYGLYINGTFDGSIYYDNGNDARIIVTSEQHWGGFVNTEQNARIKFNSYAYLEYAHDAWLGIQLESWSGTDNFTWNATSVASQTVQWSWSRGESSAMYDEYQDGIYIGSDETNAGGMGEFTSTFMGTHAFLLSRSSFLPASTDISDDVWLGIIFMSIATLITLFGYIRNIGLVMIISFLLLVIGTLVSTQIWVELWTLPTLFILVNAVLMTHGLLRKV